MEKESLSQVTGGEKKEVASPSPYVLYSSDNPGAVITSVKLNGENDNEWSVEMLNALQAKRRTQDRLHQWNHQETRKWR